MRRVLILGNALDDAMRLERGITTDSPAASRKMMMMARALRQAGVSATIVSLGRGRNTGGQRWHPAAVHRCAGVAIVYAPFIDRPIVSSLVSLAAPAIIVSRRRRGSTLLVYNRSLAYLPALFIARLRKMPVVLDLEDGFTGTGTSGRERLIRFGHRLFDRLCGGRALLACSALAAATRLRPAMPYYGISGPGAARTAGGSTVTALLGGTVDAETGGERLADAVAQLRRDAPGWAARLTLDVTGKGASLPRLEALAAEPGSPMLRVWGRMTDAEYDAIRARVTIGLALKRNCGALANTTFPSKVIEMASAGQLVVTTDISDVRAVLGDDGALFLTDDEPGSLVAALEWIVTHPVEVRAIAEVGRAAVARLCSADAAGQRLATFLFPEGA